MAMHLPEPETRAPPKLAPQRRDTLSESDDQLFTINGVTWEAYEAICEALSDHAGLRMTYLEGTLELMSPGKTHEWVKSTLRRLIEVYAEEMRIDLSAYGSTTFRKKAKKRGAEPDECYFLDLRRETPELAI